MKTIEERAKKAGILCQYKSDYRYDKRSVESGYIKGAKEQKVIDDAECINQVLMGKGSAINHYKQGFHDAVEKACEWLDTYLMEIGYPDDWMRDSPNVESGKERFKKIMGI